MNTLIIRFRNGKVRRYHGVSKVKISIEPEGKVLTFNRDIGAYTDLQWVKFDNIEEVIVQ